MEKVVAVLNGYIETVNSDHTLDTSSKRRYCLSLGSFKNYLIRERIHTLHKFNVENYILYKAAKTGRDSGISKQDFAPIKRFIEFARCKGHIGKSEDFNIVCNTSDELIKLYSVNEWKRIDRLIDYWVNEPGIDTDIKYKRVVVATYVEFMNKSRPLGSRVADTLRWCHVVDGRIVIIGSPEIPLRDGARRILSQWMAMSRWTDGDDLVFCNARGIVFNSLQNMHNMLMDIKVRIFFIIKSSGHDSDATEKLRPLWDTVLDLYRHANAALRLQNERIQNHNEYMAFVQLSLERKHT